MKRLCEYNVRGGGECTAFESTVVIGCLSEDAVRMPVMEITSAPSSVLVPSVGSKTFTCWLALGLLATEVFGGSFSILVVVGGIPRVRRTMRPYLYRTFT